MSFSDSPRSVNGMDKTAHFGRIEGKEVDLLVETSSTSHTRVSGEFPSPIPGQAIDSVESSESQLDADQIDEQLQAVENLLDLDKKRLLDNQQLLKTIQGNFREGMEVIKWTPQLLNEWILIPYGNISPFIKIPDKISKGINEVFNSIRILQTALGGVETVGNGAALIAKGIQYHHIKFLYEKAKETLKDVPEEQSLKNLIADLKGIISAEKKELKTKIADYARATAMTALRITSFVLKAFQTVNRFVKGSVGWTISGLGVLGSAIALWRENKGKATYEMWMKEITENPESSNQAEELLAKREERMILKAVEKQPFSNVKQYLEENKEWFQTQKGLVIPEINNLEDFKAALSDPTFRIGMKIFISEEDKTIEELNEKTRDSLKNLFKVKAKHEKRVFDFNLTRQKVDFALFCLSTAISLTLGILSVAGVIALAASTMAIPGLGFFLLGLGIAGVGMYFFYKRKPNLFQCYIRCVNLRLMFFNIPSKIRNWQLSKKEHAITALQAQLDGLLEQSKREGLDEKRREELSKKIEDLKNLEEVYQDKLTKVRQKVEYWTGESGKITQLQNRLIEAGNKDFEIAYRLMTDAKDRELDLPAQIADQIIHMHAVSYLDEDTQKVLKEKMGIDLNKITYGENGMLDEASLVNRLKNFFKMDGGEFLGFIRKQLSDIEKARVIPTSNQLQ